MFEISFLGAFGAGLLSFITPCVLPMVPFYLSYMGGLSMNELRYEGGILPGAHRRLVVAAVSFAAGVISIFMLLGMGATALGQLFGQYMDGLSYVAALVLVVFGLHFLGMIRVPVLYRQARLDGGGFAPGLLGGYMMGLAFGFGWTPCVGPALAAILMIASGMGDIWRGGALLLVYGVGMTAPFVFAALFARQFLALISRHRAMVATAEKVMGLMLILFAVLIVTGGVQGVANAMLEWLPGATTLG